MWMMVSCVVDIHMKDLTMENKGEVKELTPVGTA
jgi:hypothetical protein